MCSSRATARHTLWIICSLLFCSAGVARADVFWYQEGHDQPLYSIGKNRAEADKALAQFGQWNDPNITFSNRNVTKRCSTGSWFVYLEGHKGATPADGFIYAYGCYKGTRADAVKKIVYDCIREKVLACSKNNIHLIISGFDNGRTPTEADHWNNASPYFGSSANKLKACFIALNGERQPYDKGGCADGNDL